MTATAKALALTMAAMMLVGCGVARGTPQTAYVAPRGPFLPLPEHRRIPFPAATPSPFAAPAVPDPTLPPPVVSPVIRGRATWYCNTSHPEVVLSACPHGMTGGMFAAAGPALQAWLGTGWRGMRVQVCAGVCVQVTLVDSCGGGCQSLIDLFYDPFSQLAPLSRGVLSVTISR